MSQTSYILVHLVEKLVDGIQFERKRAVWPLHITLVSWFRIDDDHVPQLINSLNVFAQQTKGFEARVGSVQLFGPHKDVPVNVMASQTELRHLRQSLLELVSGYNISFHGNASPMSGLIEQYVAHITHHDSPDGLHRRFEGDVEEVNDVTLIKLIESSKVQHCEVVRTFAFTHTVSEGGAA